MLFFGLDAEKNDQGLYLVHRLGCRQYPHRDKLIQLGRFDSCEEAVAEAKTHRTPVNGCWACIPLCHERSLSSVKSYLMLD